MALIRLRGVVVLFCLWGLSVHGVKAFKKEFEQEEEKKE
jgi:hypothetical protein